MRRGDGERRPAGKFRLRKALGAMGRERTMSDCTDPGCRGLAAQFLRKQCKQLLAQLPGIREATDTEYIHRARVASRRLRAGLRLFGDVLPHRKLPRWEKQVRRVTRGLGAARDLDVQRDYLLEVLAHLESAAEYPGIARLLAQTEATRDRRQSQVLRAIQRLEKSKVLPEMRRVLKPSTEAEEKGPSSPPCVQLARQHIGEGLEEVLSFEESLEDSEDYQQHHALRIAAKRLRYTVEICRPVFGTRLDCVLEVIKQLQTLLGEVHDCDVWIEQLPRMLEDERRQIVKRYGHAGPLERIQPGVVALLDRQRQRRQERFAELRRFWQEQLQPQTWPQLQAVLQGDAADPNMTARKEA